VIPVIDQCPLSGAVIAQPVVLHAPRLLPGTNKRGHGGFSRLDYAVGFNQKEFSFSEPEERLGTLRIGALAKHGFHCLLLGQGTTSASNGFRIMSTSHANGLPDAAVRVRTIPSRFSSALSSCFAD